MISTKDQSGSGLIGFLCLPITAIKNSTNTKGTIAVDGNSGTVGVGWVVSNVCVGVAVVPVVDVVGV